MSYENEAAGFENYRTIGTMSVPKMSVKTTAKDSVIDFTGKISETMLNYGTRGELPKIVLGESAFTITLVDALKKPLESFVGIITSVRNYEIDKSQDYLHIIFSYRPAVERAKLPQIPTIPSMVTKIVQHDDFCAILFEGVKDASTTEYINRQTDIFYHGTGIYHRYCQVDLSTNFGTVDDPMWVHLGNVVFASAQKVPNVDELIQFANGFLKEIGHPIDMTKTIQDQQAKIMASEEPVVNTGESDEE